MKPNPLSALDVPADWPTTARKPNGEVIELHKAWETMSHDGLAMLEVDVPGVGWTTPYSNLAGFDNFEIPEETEGLLTREDLEANGSSDAVLTTWAKEKYGIVLDLAGEDTTSLQAIRGDAWLRFVADTDW